MVAAAAVVVAMGMPGVSSPWFLLGDDGKASLGISGKASKAGSIVSRGVDVGEDSRVEASLWLLLLQQQSPFDEVNGLLQWTA